MKNWLHALAHLPNVEEKRMFGGVAFMVDGKMCINVSGNEMMCRIDPDIYNELIKKKGCGPMMMKGREMKGYVLVSEEGMENNNEFDYWIGLSLDFNKKAKASKKKKK